MLPLGNTIVQFLCVPLFAGYSYSSNNYMVSGLFFMVFWCPCMAMNVSVQYNGGLLPDIILLTQFYFHRGTRSNDVKRFCICSL